MNALLNLWSLVPIIATGMVILALALLWRRQHSVWLIVAIAAEALGIVFRILTVVSPELARTAPLVYSVWSLTGFAFAAGLLGYAIESTQRT